jgi:hypothetical protein
MKPGSLKHCSNKCILNYTFSYNIPDMVLVEVPEIDCSHLEARTHLQKQF